MKEALRILGLTCAIVLHLNACKKASTPNDENEHEAINKIELVMSSGGVVTGTFIVEDVDGDGGNPPSRIDTIKLAPGKTYTASISFKNIVGTVVKDLTTTIKAQGNAHEVFYLPTGISVVVTKTDTDAVGRPLGLNSTWQTSATGTGIVLIKLMHKPFSKGMNDGPDVGHSDISIYVPLKIQ
jgi:hypothetical protein